MISVSPPTAAASADAVAPALIVTVWLAALVTTGEPAVPVAPLSLKLVAVPAGAKYWFSPPGVVPR